MENEEQKYIFSKENIDDADVWKKHTLSTLFLGHGCVAIHVASDPPPPPRDWEPSCKVQQT